MRLILKRINEYTSVPDIQGFLEPALNGGLFKKSGRIDNIVIQMHLQTGISEREYYGIVDVEPDIVAMRVIKILNRKPLNGKAINIAELQIRQYSNDVHEYYQSTDLQHRVCRRRKGLEIVDITTERKNARTSFSAFPSRD